MSIFNISIIAHIDHGKSTLADRFLELTNTLPKDKINPQVLDSMDLEKEKGITIKMHPVRMEFNGNIINLIDTPGHIDFSYEISRALACVEGAILLVDATQGVQAQTIFNLSSAQKQGLTIIGVVNKIDIATPDQIEQAIKELAFILGKEQKEIITISAKTGHNVDKLLGLVIKRIKPFLSNTPQKPFQALIFDSKYDSFAGVIAFVRVFQGEIKKNDKIKLLAVKYQTEVKEVGYFKPHLLSSASLKAGEIGYLKTGIKIPEKVKVGDTIGVSDRKQQATKPLPGYQEPQPVLYLSIYPALESDFSLLTEGLEKLKLNDPGLVFQLESQQALGRGYRIGFLGSLHAEIVVRRLKAEYNLDLILTAPQVVFKVKTKGQEEVEISSASDYPDPSTIEMIEEPWAELEVVVPSNYINQILKHFKNFNVSLIKTKVLSSTKIILIGQISLRELISGNFYDQLKSISQGYASFSFKQIGYQPADLVKMDILIAGKPEPALSRVVGRGQAFEQGKRIVKKLKDILPVQQFVVSLQAAIGSKIIARETLSARRKDVTAPLYGGDITRKRKLLDIQKKGKKKLKENSRISIPTSVFLEIIKNN